MNAPPPPPPGFPPGPPPLSAAPAASPGPLTPEHYQLLAQANQRAAKLRSAGKVAMFNGICIGSFAALSLLLVPVEAAFGELDWVAIVMGLGLAVLAWNEFRGRRLLQQFDQRAPSLLGWNQVALLGLVVAYAAWMMAGGLLGKNPVDEALRAEPAAAGMLEGFGGLYRMMTVLMYGTLIAGTLIFQGLNALYYFRRGPILRDYLAQTPEWVVQLQRAQAGGR